MNALRKRKIGAVALVLALLGAVIATGPPAARAAEPMVVSVARAFPVTGGGRDVPGRGVCHGQPGAERGAVQADV